MFHPARPVGEVVLSADCQGPGAPKKLPEGVQGGIEAEAIIRSGEPVSRVRRDHEEDGDAGASAGQPCPMKEEGLRRQHGVSRQWLPIGPISENGLGLQAWLSGVELVVS